MNELLSGYRLFADHGQFYAFDESVDPYEPEPEFTEENVRRGWARNENAIYYFTVGQLWEFRLDIYFSDVIPEKENAERLLRHNLSLSTGKLIVGNPLVEEIPVVELESGDYSVYLRVYNLGKEADDNAEEDEVLHNMGLERYELIVVPGFSDEDCLIYGNATLW